MAKHSLLLILSRLAEGRIKKELQHPKEILHSLLNYEKGKILKNVGALETISLNISLKEPTHLLLR